MATDNRSTSHRYNVHVRVSRVLGTLDGYLTFIELDRMEIWYMKKLAAAGLVLSFALAFAVGAQAQAPKEHSMTGCLQKGAEPDTYMVTNVEGNGPKTIGIVSSTVSLATHVGHKIQVTGTAVPAKEAEADNKVPKAAHYMNLTAIKMISTTCP